ncbi:MAG: hypothetical protein K6F45_06055 [Saccharofermentans sp.]|jgi:hypothetical protein|nr:hypothetical protein [Saccharofermentans sp.]
MASFSSENVKIDRNGNTVGRMDVMVSAMWELMLEKGFTREQLNAKLDKVKEQRITLEPKLNRVECPKCGKLISENAATPFEGKCIYCGQTVTIYPGDSIEFKKDNEPLQDNSSSAFDDPDQF